MKIGRKILIVVACVVVAFLAFVIGRMGGADVNTTVLQSEETTPVEGNVYDRDSWAEQYPLQYQSYMKTSESGDTPGRYGGNELYQHWDMQPEILVNFAGYGFSKDYQDDRGHYYAIEDISATKRVNETTRGACITCKTPYLEEIIDTYGWDYAAMPFADILAMVPEDHGSISCANCHDPDTMDLRVINLAFIEAMERTGVDLEAATTDEMRSYVCAQCHSEYYFQPETFIVTFPWDNGTEVDEVYEYYAAKPNDFVKDYVQPDSQVDVLKAQHPDYEMWASGVHGMSGVSCADCHMPYTVENGEKYSSHWVTSPLRTIENSCGNCHDQGSAWLKEQVLYIQDSVWTLQHESGLAVASAHEAIAKASAIEGVNETELNNARELVRKAQWFWDYLAASNSMGFHNPSQATKCGTVAIESANKAIMTAYKAANLEL